MSTTTLAASVSARPGTAGRRGSSVRLTRRGRVVVVMLTLAVVLAVGFALASRSVATDHPGRPQQVRMVTVAPGETLWDIAADAAGAGDVRTMVQRIEQLNALDSGLVSAGQRIAVPVG